jgi:hypothetical protein
MLNLLKFNVAIDQNASHAGGNVHEPAKTPVTLKPEQSAHFLFGGSTPLVADTEQPPKATPGRCLDICVGIKKEERGSMRTDNVAF